MEPDAQGRTARVQTYGILLGQASGTSVLFDLCLKRIVRIPSGLLVLVQDEESAGPGDPHQTAKQAQDSRAAYCASLGRQFR
jgi:hypothetical protein